MAKPKRRRTATKAKTRIGAGWWLAGLAALGWTVHTANPSLLDGVASQAYTMAGMRDAPSGNRSTAAAPTPQRTAAREAPPAQARATGQARVATQAPAPAPRQASPTPPAPVPARGAQTASLARPATPAARPAEAARQRTPARGQVRLRSEPKENATIRATVQAGRTLRVVESKGDWRRVEAGIFTGWIRAAELGGSGASGSARPTAMKLPTMSPGNSAPRTSQPATPNRKVPPGSLPDGQ